jgi:hypothetical protein
MTLYANNATAITANSDGTMFPANLLIAPFFDVPLPLTADSVIPLGDDPSVKLAPQVVVKYDVSCDPNKPG